MCVSLDTVNSFTTEPIEGLLSAWLSTYQVPPPPSEGRDRADGQGCALCEVLRAGYLLCLVHNQLSYPSLLHFRFNFPPSRSNKDTDVTYRY
jgi:hypothetical protein